MDFYDIRTTVILGISLCCIFWFYMIIKRNPHKTLFGRPVPSNLMPILIVLFVVSGVVAVVFKPDPVKYPSYIAISPAGEIQYKY